MTRFPNEGPQPTREDVLIGRVADGEATPLDWSELETIARQDTGVWQRLAEAQRAHARLEQGVEDAIAIAELVDVPARMPAVPKFAARIREYGGWAAAAVVGVVWMTSTGMITQVNRSAMNHPIQPMAGQANIFPVSLAPDEAWDQYIEAGRNSGRVVEVMPELMVNARPVGQGGEQEVFYVRRILERATVNDMTFFKVQQTEHGTPTFVPMTADELAAPNPL